MKCLFLFQDAPLSPNYSGGASRYLESFLALVQLGVEVHVWRMLSIEQRDNILNFEENEPGWKEKTHRLACSWRDASYSQSFSPDRFEIFVRSLLDPIYVAFAPYTRLKNEFQETVRTVQPNFVWAEHTQSAALVSTSSIHLPWIYSHHDWWHKIVQVRRELRKSPHYLSQRMLDFALKRAEIVLAPKANVVISGSKTEAEELSYLGARHVQVIPTTYPFTTVDLSQKVNVDKVRIVHLGGLNTTANYQGLLSYLERAHPQIAAVLRNKVELIVIGETRTAKSVLLEKLREHGATLTGHVYDLSSVLSPYDIAIIPYEMNTGTRTKLGLLFSHAQVVVATQAALSGSIEAQHGENCLIVQSVDEFPQTIINLANSPYERQGIGIAARSTFEAKFTIQSQAPKFKQVLSWLVM